jgi:hypothetical protein
MTPPLPFCGSINLLNNTLGNTRSGPFFDTVTFQKARYGNDSKPVPVTRPFRSSPASWAGINGELTTPDDPMVQDPPPAPLTPIARCPAG